MPIDLQRYPFYGAAVNVDIWPSGPSLVSGITRLRDPGVEVSSTIFNWAAHGLGEMTPTLDLCPARPCPRGMLVNEHDKTSWTLDHMIIPSQFSPPPQRIALLPEARMQQFLSPR